MTEAVKRRYDSTRRRAQAEATKREILEAAERLFSEQGYVATTIAAIASEARVAPKTVYLAFETKAGLLRALWNLRLRGTPTRCRSETASGTARCSRSPTRRARSD